MELLAQQLLHLVVGKQFFLDQHVAKSLVLRLAGQAVRQLFLGDKFCLNGKGADIALERGVLQQFLQVFLGQHPGF